MLDDRRYFAYNVLSCNVCRKPVPRNQHQEHLAILDAVFTVVDGDPADVFVHMQGAKDEFDEDGNVVVCDRHLIEELCNEWAQPTMRARGC
jgi:hypothetical protein